MVCIRENIGMTDIKKKSEFVTSLETNANDFNTDPAVMRNWLYT